MRAVRLTISHPIRGLSGNDSLALVFGAERASFLPTDSPATIRAAVQAMVAVEGAQVAVSGSAASPGGELTVVIAFTRFAAGTERNLYRHDGDPPLSYFFCDTTGAAGGLTATATVSALPAEFLVQIDGTGARYVFRRVRGPGSDGGVNTVGPFTLAAGGNSEIVSDGSVALRFSPVVGRPAGERWRVIVGRGGATTVIPDVACSVSDVDRGLLTAASAYSGAAGVEYRLRIEQPLADGTCTFAWRTSELGSQWSPATPITEANQTLSNGVVVQWASRFGHGVNATWTIAAAPPLGSVSPGRAALMTGRGDASTATNVYRIVIANGSMTPALLQYSVRATPAFAAASAQSLASVTRSSVLRRTRLCRAQECRL